MTIYPGIKKDRADTLLTTWQEYLADLLSRPWHPASRKDERDLESWWQDTIRRCLACVGRR